MGDYIEREAFIEDVKTEIINLSMDGLKGTRMPHDELYGFIERIKSQPAADVAPVVHGRWEHTHTSESYFIECWRCSECGFDDTELFGFNFCPNCGAKMDKEDTP